MSKTREELEAALHDFLQGLASSGDWPLFRGVVTGWSIWVDRIDPEDNDYWSSRLDAPGQSQTLSLGQHVAARNQIESNWEVVEEDEE